MELDYFKNVGQVATYLNQEGWKVTQRTVYNHAKKGLLNKSTDGTFSLKAVKKYAAGYLTTIDTAETIEDGKNRKEKERLEKELLQEKVKRERIKRMYEEGKYVERDMFYLELAARGAVFDSMFKGMIQARAGEFVALVDGDETKTNQLVQELMSEVDRVLTEFCNIKAFHVMFGEDSDSGDH